MAPSLKADSLDAVLGSDSLGLCANLGALCSEYQALDAAGKATARNALGPGIYDSLFDHAEFTQASIFRSMGRSSRRGTGSRFFEVEDSIDLSAYDADITEALDDWSASLNPGFLYGGYGMGAYGATTPDVIGVGAGTCADVFGAYPCTKGSYSGTFGAATPQPAYPAFSQAPGSFVPPMMYPTFPQSQAGFYPIAAFGPAPAMMPPSLMSPYGGIVPQVAGYQTQLPFMMQPFTAFPQPIDPAMGLGPQLVGIQAVGLPGIGAPSGGLPSGNLEPMPGNTPEAEALFPSQPLPSQPLPSQPLPSQPLPSQPLTGQPKETPDVKAPHPAAEELAADDGVSEAAKQAVTPTRTITTSQPRQQQPTLWQRLRGGRSNDTARNQPQAASQASLKETDSSVYFTPAYILRQSDNAADSVGHDERGFALTLGFDQKLSPSWSAGAAVNYSRTEIESDGLNANATVNGFLGAGYAHYENEGFFGDVKMGAGYSLADVSRNVTVGALSESSTGEAGVYTMMMDVQLGASLMDYFGSASRGQGVLGRSDVRPYIGAGLQWSRLDGFEETGGTNTRLETAAISSSGYSFEVGSEFDTQVALSNSVLVPNLQIAYQYSGKGDRNHNVGFAQAIDWTDKPGTLFDYQGRDMSGSSILVGGGLSWVSAGVFDAFVRYDGSIGLGDLENTTHKATLGFRVNF